MHKTITTVLAVAAVCATTHTVFAKKGGTSILHLTVTSTLTGDGASGSVSADHKLQGGAEKQSLTIKATGLAPETTYALLASTTDDTNLTQAAEVTTDANGDLSVAYAKKGQGKGAPKGGPIPALLDPVSDLRAIEISLGGTQTVLSADMTAPSSIQYLVKRALDNDSAEPTAAASLRMKSNGISNQLRIRASGLTSNATYHLALNEVLGDALTADANGNLSITELPGGAPDVLDITHLAIVDGGTNSVLSTELP